LVGWLDLGGNVVVHPAIFAQQHNKMLYWAA